MPAGCSAAAMTMIGARMVKIYSSQGRRSDLIHRLLGLSIRPTARIIGADEQY